MRRSGQRVHGVTECASLPPTRRVRKPGPTLEQGAVLEAARRAKADADEAEARKLAAAVEWCRLHEVADPDDAETWDQTPILLAGEGAPMIATGAVAEFAAVIGTSTGGGRYYLADALELAHRLPLLYARTQDGTLPVWKARAIARQTSELDPETAAVVDQRVAPLAAGLSAKATEHLASEVVAELMPAYAQEQADRYSLPHVLVDHRQVSFLGTSAVHASLDLADALDLDAALAAGAEALKLAGSQDPLDARRAAALGSLARGESPGRQVTLYVHLPIDTDSSTAKVENGGGRLLTQAQVAAWCAKPDVKVVVKPVIDLHTPVATAAYVVPDSIREHLQLRDTTCVFPDCDKSARTAEKDHITAYDAGGATSTDNLADLCGHHHHLKTHTGWTYTMLEPGYFLWRSPHGYTWLRTPHGTHPLTPRPLAPPG
ncbi:MAG TPA: HNH endonuclease signature motif containing protein, partial [Marmoricola sp.]|nr:HNH endonuclease signature motif containing protein [Marmoricola sp.]